MSNARGKHVDTTYLSIDTAEERGFIHRDYIAHCLRWSHVVKRLTQQHNYKTARILDVGCGREVPLASTLYSSKLIVASYVGVDVGPIPDENLAKFGTGKFPIHVWERADICSIASEDLQGGTPNWVTCFEVLEHVEPAHMVRMLRHLIKLAPGARFFFSTPCWNRTDCAANHVNEITYEALGSIFEAVGFHVVNHYGTYASIRDYEHMISGYPENLLAQKGIPYELFNKLREYYDSNLLSIIFAPLYPQHSRNCIWELREALGDKTDSPKFKTLTDCQRPWSSSEKWEEFVEAIYGS